MSKTLAELVSVLAQKAGIPADDATLKTILATDAVAKSEIPAEFHDKFAGALFSENSAKNNADLFKHFTAKALANIDSKLGPMAKELLEGDSFTLFEKEIDTYKKFDLLGGKLSGKLAELKKAVEEAGKNGGNQTEAQKQQAATLQGEVQKLTAEMATLKTDYESKLSGKDSEFAQLRLSETAKRLIANQPWSDQYNAGDRELLGETKFRAKLAKEGVTASLNEVGEVVFKKADGLDYLDNVGNKVTFDAFFAPIMTENNYLKASNGNSTSGHDSGGGNNGHYNGGGDNPAKGKGLTPQQQAAFDAAEAAYKI